MNQIYDLITGLRSVDPKKVLKQTKYEFNDVQTWLPHVFIACATAHQDTDTINSIMTHLRNHTNFCQFEDTTIRDLIVHLADIMNKTDITPKDQVFYVGFICDLLNTRDDNFGESPFINLISLERVAIWAMQNILSEDLSQKSVSTFFIGLYSMLGNRECDIIEQNMTKEIRATFLQIFENPYESKIDIGLRLGFLLIFFNIWSKNPGSHSSQIASKIFQAKENCMIVFRICGEAIAKDNGGLSGLTTACNLLIQIAQHSRDLFLEYENSKSRDKKSAAKIIKSSISFLRSDNDSDKQTAILKMLHSMAEIDDTIKELIISRFSIEEEDADSSILWTLSQKSPIRHGSLPCISTKLIVFLGTVDFVNMSVEIMETQFSGLMCDLERTTEKNIFFIYQKLAHLTDILRQLLKPGSVSTQKLDYTESTQFTDVSSILCKLNASATLINYAFVGIHCWIAGTPSEDNKLNDVQYRLFLSQSIAVLLASNIPNHRRLATDLIRCVPDHVYTSICTPRVFSFFHLKEEARKPRVEKGPESPVPAGLLKENTNRRTKDFIRRLSTNMIDDTENTKKRKRSGDSESERVCQALREQLAQTEAVLESERNLRQSLEKMIAVSGSNQGLSKRLIISIDNSKIEAENERQNREFMVRGIAKYLK